MLATEPGAAGRNIQTARRPTAVGHPDGDGPDDSTGAAADPATILRPDVFERQLWLSSETQRASSDTARPGTILAGYDWVVDLDLERFFDRVNHDVLMARVARLGEGQADGATDPALLAGRVDGGRAGIAADGGYTARGARCHLW